MKMDTFLSAKEAAERLGVSIVTLRRWARQERIKAIRTPGGRFRYPLSEINRILGIEEENGRIEHSDPSDPDVPLERTRKPGRKPKFTAEEVAEAVKRAKGFLTVAAQILGCHYRTILNYAQRYKIVREALDEARQQVLDVAEAKLLEQVQAGDLRAIMFYLRTFGKTRGYIERLEITTPQPFKFSFEVPEWVTEEDEEDEENP
jgi:excisionase family DNA binding protein